MKILLRKNEILAMAQKQGSIKNFTFYTLDNEFPSHYPHVHICIKNDGKTKGVPLKNGSNLLSLGSVKLRPDNNYTVENLEFETLINEDLDTIKNRKIIVEWLTDIHKKLKIENCFKCVSDYDDSNPNYKNRIAYQRHLGEL